ncbi:MAG: hypothetical protein Q8P12_07265 [bacterium]|nr:hypothetical protein [bacterium]
MTVFVNAADLDGLQIEAQGTGEFRIQACCPICRSLVSLSIDAPDAEMRREVSTECRSGQDWPRFFQLCARYSPDETDDESGVDVWGMVKRDVNQERYD